MKAANIFHDLRNISSKDIITKTELLKLLKKYCKIISPYDLMLATARMREEGKYVILDEPIQSEQYGIGFAKGNEELRDTVWAEVMKLYDEGEIDKLAEQYGVVDMLCLGD